MHVAIDDHSRVAYVEMLAADDGPTATEFVARAQAWFATKGVTTQRVLTDNGGGYISTSSPAGAMNWASSAVAPNLTDREPTAKPNG